MLRYYMTPETREALIAESNRIIAARAAAKAAKKSADTSPGDLPGYSGWDLWGAMPYAPRGPVAAPRYQGLMSFLVVHPAR